MSSVKVFYIFNLKIPAYSTGVASPGVKPQFVSTVRVKLVVRSSVLVL